MNRVLNAKATQFQVTCFFKLDEPTGFSATASKKAIMAFGWQNGCLSKMGPSGKESIR
ncbi:hypothetical protein [Niastella vici]|uniref:hypothetical protein n=1 Tax=Niastella vici TaxID=1703345 RepID=UPI001301A358|nr:hypothetical protein [Niastella vici]